MDEVIVDEVNYGKNGYVGTWLCDENGIFQTHPTVRVEMPESYSEVIPGISIIWSKVYNEWATKFIIRAYHGERVVFAGTYENDAVQTTATGDISEYDCVEIEILEWCKGYRRARIQDVFLGINQTYSKSDIMEFSASMFVDPISGSLPKSEIKFKLKNLDGQYNLDNPKNKARYLTERQQMTVKYGYKIDGIVEWIKGGTFYLSEWETPQNGITASFAARDAIEFLSAPYEGVVTGTLYDVAVAAFEQADLPSTEDGGQSWEVASVLSTINVPEDLLDLSSRTLAEVLLLCANAGGCVFYQGRDGVLKIEKLHQVLSDYVIDGYVSYSNSEVRLLKQLQSVNINNGQYILPVGKKGEVQPMLNELISDVQAPEIAEFVAKYLENRRVYSGDYRADPRLDPLTVITNENKYAKNYVLVTNFDLTYKGAFKGSYEGRGLVGFSSAYPYAGDSVYAGAIWLC